MKLEEQKLPKQKKKFIDFIIRRKKTNARVEGKQGMKYAEVWVFSDQCFPLYGQNHIRVIPYFDRIRKFV